MHTEGRGQTETDIGGIEGTRGGGLAAGGEGGGRREGVVNGEGGRVLAGAETVHYDRDRA